MSESTQNQILNAFKLLQMVALFLSAYYFTAINGDLKDLKTELSALKIHVAELNIKIEMREPKITSISKTPTVYDTVNLVKKVAWDYRNSESVSIVLQKFPFSPTLKWFNAVFNHLALIPYVNDAAGKEQIKTPDYFYLVARKGDCDDFTTFWAALANRTNLQAHPKIVKYSRNEGFAHIYPIFPTNNRPFVMDNVYGLFNKEVNHAYAEIL